VNESMEYLAPIILTCMAVGVICLVMVAWHTWREWPQPSAWRSKYGTVPRPRR
jgi:hypothetical protein